MPSITVEARRSDNTRDNTFTGNITIAKESGPGVISGTLTQAAVAGVATFSDIQFNQIGVYTISATSTPLTVAVSGDVRILTLSEVILPQYIEGVRPTNTNRIPHTYWVKINGLSVNAAYRYSNQVVIASDAAGSNRADNPIYVSKTGDFVRTTSVSLCTPGRYGTFTTNASGNYAGWFVNGPTSNATRFVPGIDIFMRIALNNGTEGPGDTLTAIRLTTTESSKVFKLDPANSDTTGTGLWGSSLASAKDFMLLYDNVTGTGRPISASFIESDGTDNTIANSYTAFYSNDVNGVDGAFGVIVPNQLPNGVRRIERRSLTDGTIIAATTDQDVIWPSGANTVNPSGGSTPLVINLT